jgi:catechol 2,3-dioxygenase-like lactoylglutathione lyase family enzyme
MNRLAFAITIVLTASRSARAQLLPADAAGLTMGHVHLNVRDVEAHKRFWVEQIGARPVKLGSWEGVSIPGMLIFFRRQDPTGPVTGEVINHMGLKVRRLSDLLAVFQKGGSKTEAVRIGRENTPQTYVIGPEEFRIELVEDGSLATPVASHHLHFFIQDPYDVKRFYVEKLRLTAAMRGPYESGDLPGINLSFAPNHAGPTVPTRGRSLDHIGFEVKDLAAYCRKLEAAGVKMDAPYHRLPDAPLAAASLTDPWGASIELTEGLDQAR